MGGKILAIENDLKKMGFAAVLLLTIALLFVIAVLAEPKIKEVACEVTSTDFTWDATAGACENSTGTAQTVDAVTTTDTVFAGLDIILGFLSLAILLFAIKPVISMAKGLGSGKDF